MWTSNAFRPVLIVALVVGLLSLIGIVSKRLSSKKVVSSERVLIPNITVTQLDNSLVSLHSLSSRSPTLLVLVNSECSVCVGQVDELYKRGRLLQNVKIVLLSYQSLLDISAFSSQYLNSPFVFGQVDLHVLNEHFGDFSTPHLFLYDEHYQLIKELKGVNRVVHLKKYFEKDNL